jgi:dihydrofolate synthase/folylpolyglutamate synthase
LLKTIDEALDYLYSFIDHEVVTTHPYVALHYNVERTLQLLDLLKNPERGIKIIHVAGTKGKGSVCTILDSLLRVQSYTTGLFISPHVERVNERISVNGCQISDDEMIDIMNKMHPLLDTFPAKNKPTTFEILTAMAMYFFRMKEVSYCVLETGMGGRFDSTNFADPVISVITSISYDHMDKLGDTIESIAFEKAGIIKRGRPVVVGFQRYNVMDLFIAKADEMQSPLYRADSLCSYDVVKYTEIGVFFNASIDGVHFRDLFISLPGRHQVENAVVALLSLKVLGLLPGQELVQKALGSLHFPTRLELIEGKRKFLLDSAHNADSARALAEAIRSSFCYRNLIAIVGIVKGKDVDGIIRHIVTISDSLIITDPVTHKEIDTDAVYKVARSYRPDARLIHDIHEAIEYAVESSSSDDIVLITGSFYTTSPARSYLLGRVQ